MKTEIKNKSGQVICTVEFNPNDPKIYARYKAAAKLIEGATHSLLKIGLSADGSATHPQYRLNLWKAESKVKRAIKSLEIVDKPESLFAECRPFASVGGTFYCVQVIHALGAAVSSAKK